MVRDVTGWGDVVKDLGVEFVKAKAAVQVKIQRGGTREEAIEKLLSGETELLLADGAISPSGQATESPHPDPLPKGEGTKMALPKGEGTNAGGPGPSPKAAGVPRGVEIARVAVAVIVHPDNPLKSLSVGEARAIFSAENRKCPDAKGAAAAMHVFGPKQGDSATRVLRETLGIDKPLNYRAEVDTEKVILAVARDPAAIGFVDMAQLSPTEKSVKFVPVVQSSPAASDDGRGKGKAPASKPPSTIPNALQRTLVLYVSPTASQTAKDFADFLTPEHCKETIAQYNLLPPPPRPKEASQVAKTGSPSDKAKDAARPNSAAKRDGTTDLASAGKPIPPNTPGTPQDQSAGTTGPTSSESADAESETPASDEAVSTEPTLASDDASATASEPSPESAQESADDSSSNGGTIWLVGGIGGVVVLAAGIGWLSAARRKPPRLPLPK